MKLQSVEALNYCMWEKWPLICVFWSSNLSKSNLKWNQRQDNIVANGNKSLGFLKRNLKISNSDVKSRAYQSIVRPKPEYSCRVWDLHNARSVNKIEIVQRWAARYVYNNYHNTSSVANMIDNLGWATLAERRLKTSYVFKVTHYLIAIPFHVSIPSDSRTRKITHKHFDKLLLQKIHTNGNFSHIQYK